MQRIVRKNCVCKNSGFSIIEQTAGLDLDRMQKFYVLVFHIVE